MGLKQKITALQRLKYFPEMYFLNFIIVMDYISMVLVVSSHSFIHTAMGGAYSPIGRSLRLSVSSKRRQQIRGGAVLFKMLTLGPLD